MCCRERKGEGVRVSREEGVGGRDRESACVGEFVTLTKRDDLLGNVLERS